jgi:hypothetical protein
MNSSVDACISLANIWADEALAKYQAECAKSKEASTFDFLSSADTIKDKNAIMAGRERGVTNIQAFDERWNNAGGNSCQ